MGWNEMGQDKMGQDRTGGMGLDGVRFSFVCHCCFLSTLIQHNCSLPLQIVFMTALFYLLNFSSDSYLPMQWLSKLTPTMGGGQSKYTTAVENAIRYVSMLGVGG